MMNKKIWQSVIIVIFILYVIIPISAPIIYSFSTFWQGLLPKGFTLKWYRIFIEDPDVQPSLILSLIVAISATLINIAIVVPATYAINRLKGKVARLLEDLFTIIPLIFPPLIVGLGLIQSFNKPPFDLSGTVAMVIIAHSLLGFPFMFRNVFASLKTINEKLLSEAAASLGASLSQRMFMVIIPNIMPGILAGALLVFAISFGEFEVTSMVAGFMSQTLPLVLFQQMRNDFRIASAISALLIYISLTSFLIITYIGTKFQRGKAV